jgi:RND superfamily putative drug exporter
MAFVDTLFTAAGRLSVRFRWAIVLAWVAGAVAAMALLPSLSSVTQSDNTSFLPGSAPSEQAAQLASPLQGATLTAVTVVAARTDGTLTGADQAFVARLAGSLSRVAKVVAVRDAGQSADGRAEQLTVLATLAQSGGLAAAQQATLVAGLRDVIRSAGPPPGFSVHTAGPVATRVDTNATSTKTGGQVQWFSIIFVIALLVAVFRSALAPLIAVLPAVVVVLVAERLTAVAALHGLGVSQIASLLLIVLVLGAGTDYALFLMFRVREEMRAGLPCHEAIVLSVTRVGETITFSAGVLIAALLSLATATFSLYSGLAAPLAIAIGLMLIAGLTLLPALLAIGGPVAFWPSSVKPGGGRAGWWGPTCSRIVRRPLATLVIGLVVFCALAVASAGYLAAGLGGAVTGPPGSDSAAGDALLTRHFPQTAANPTLIVLRLRQPAWATAASVAAAGRQLAADPVFTSVSGPLDANGTALTAAQYTALYAAYGPARALAASAAAQVPRAKLAAYQSYRASGSYVSADGYTISFAASLAAGSPATTAAAQAVPGIRAAAARAARAAGASASGVTGQAAFTYDVAQLSDSDLRTVIPIAIAVIAVLLALVMRSLIAPLYLIVSVVLSYFSALGLTVLVFIKAAGQPGLTFILPFLLFMFLLALGEDYNILVMTRIREEAQHLPLREAVGRALSVTGTTVSSAGLVLAGTFGVLAIVGSGSAGAQNVRTIVNVGVGLALGVLMDTFLVRTLLVPSAAVLIGRWNWWPSALSRVRPADDPSGDQDASFTTYKLLLKLTSGEMPDLTRGSHDRYRRAPWRRVFPGSLLSACPAAGAAAGLARDHAGRNARVAGHRVHGGTRRAGRSAAAQDAAGLASRPGLDLRRPRRAHAQQRPAGPRTASQASQQGLHSAPRRGAQAADHLDHHRATRRHVRSARGRPAGLVRFPAADHGDLRAARRPGRGPGRLQEMVGHHRLEHAHTRGVPGGRHRDGPLLHGAAGGQAARARRRPAVRADLSPGPGGRAPGERAGVHGVPAAGGRT